MINWTKFILTQLDLSPINQIGPILENDFIHDQLFFFIFNEN